MRYAKKWVKAKDAKTENQVEVRRTFSLTSNLWKPLPASIKNGWNSHAKGRPLTGYNLFFMSNFEAIKNGGLLELSRGNGTLTPPMNLAASINSAGEISVKFDRSDDVSQITIFVQSISGQDPKKIITSKADITGESLPVVFPGFNPEEEHNVYAISSSSAISTAETVSDSACCRVTK